MADFGGMVLTTKGLNLLAKAQTGAGLVINRVAAGAGVWADDTNAEAVTALVDERLTVPIQSMSVPGDGTVKLTVVISNSGLVAGFIFRELGVFAHDPDLGEILYAVAYAGERYDYLPAAATVVEKILDIYIVVGGAQNVTATISPGAVIALKDDLTAHEEADPAHPASKISFDNTVAGLEGDPVRVQAALEALSARTLEPIAASRQLYVSTTGSDTDNDGLSINTPFRTIDHAVSIVSLNYALGDYDVTINVAAGTYNESVVLRPYSTGKGCVNILGAGIGQTIVKSVEPGATVWTATNAGAYAIKQMSIHSPTVIASSGYAINLGCGSVSLSYVSIVGNGGMFAVIANNGSIIIFNAGCSISATSCSALIVANGGSVVMMSGLTLSGTVTWASIVVQYCGNFRRNETILPVFSGAVTGPRYSVLSNGILNIYGGGASFIPGSVAGATSSGGQYL